MKSSTSFMCSVAVVTLCLLLSLTPSHAEEKAGVVQRLLGLTDEQAAKAAPLLELLLEDNELFRLAERANQARLAATLDERRVAAKTHPTDANLNAFANAYAAKTSLQRSNRLLKAIQALLSDEQWQRVAEHLPKVKAPAEEPKDVKKLDPDRVDRGDNPLRIGVVTLKDKQRCEMGLPGNARGVLVIEGNDALEKDLMIVSISGRPVPTAREFLKYTKTHRVTGGHINFNVWKRSKKGRWERMDISRLIGEPMADAKQSPASPKKLVLNLGGGESMKLALIPAGIFQMGSLAREKGRSRDETLHKVRLTKPFYMGVYEVTQAQYDAVMGKVPSCFNGMDNPVENVSRNGAVAFCKKLSQKTGKLVRLPTVGGGLGAKPPVARKAKLWTRRQAFAPRCLADLDAIALVGASQGSDS